MSEARAVRHSRASEKRMERLSVPVYPEPEPQVKSEPLDGPAVRVWAGRDNIVPLSKEVAQKAEHLLAPAYEDEGSVDGVLEKANGHDRRGFVIFDTLTNRGITCSVDEDLMHQAVRFFFKRVEVLGKVRYRKDGQPVSVRATNIIPFPEPDEIPTLEELRDLLKGA